MGKTSEVASHRLQILLIVRGPHARNTRYSQYRKENILHQKATLSLSQHHSVAMSIHVIAIMYTLHTTLAANMQDLGGRKLGEALKLHFYQWDQSVQMIAQTEFVTEG